MKKAFMALALGLVSTSAFASTGSGNIQFKGEIYDGGTCPIEVIGPGGVNGSVDFEKLSTSLFKTAGNASAPKSFQLKVDVSDTSCGTSIARAKFTFASDDTSPGTGLFGIKSGPDLATGLGIRIKDSNNTTVQPGTANEHNFGTGLFNYSAELVSTGSVGEGQVEGDIKITVELS